MIRPLRQICALHALTVLLATSFILLPGPLGIGLSAATNTATDIAPGNEKDSAEYPLPLSGRRLLDEDPRHYDAVWQGITASAYFRKLLHTEPAILVLPFEAQANPIDKVGRSLMSRLLIERLRVRTDKRVSDFDLTDRALGHNRPEHLDDSLNQLLAMLAPEIYLRTHVGYEFNADNTARLMVVTVAAYSKDESADPPYREVARKTWREIAFDDEHLPHEAFESTAEAIATLVIPQAASSTEARSEALSKETEPPFPASPMGLIEEKDSTTARKALALQLLGVLTPETAARDRHRLFERSLMLTTALTPAHPDYAPLRARALLNLARRPAALVALREADSPEAIALRHYLDANLPPLAVAVEAIDSPLKQLIARIELNRLARRYDYRGEYEPDWKDEFLARYPGWKTAIGSTLYEHRPWQLPDILGVKKELDVHFPRPSLSLESILMAQASQRGAESVELSLVDGIVNHVQDILKTKPEATVPASGPDALDYVHMLDGITQSYAIKNVRLTFKYHGLPERASDLVEGYLTIYDGHPDLLLHQFLIHKKLASDLRGAKREAFEVSLLTLADRTMDLSYEHDSEYFRFQREVNAGLNGLPRGKRQGGPTVNQVFKRLRYLRNLFPPREVISFDLKRGRIAMKYALDDFEMLQLTYWRIQQKSQVDARTLADENAHRFEGHRDRLEFLAQVRVDSGEEESMDSYYKTAVESGSKDWSPYANLGSAHVLRGEYAEAQSVWRRYPPFHEPSSEHRVTLANRANEAASQLFWHGAHAESVPLFELSASFRTGAEAEYVSLARIATIRGDYASAAIHHFQRGRRYNSAYGFRDTLSLLHMLGESRQAWLLFDSLLGRYHIPVIWTSAVVGHRIAGADAAAIEAWVSNESRMVKANRLVSFPARFALMALTMDRPPDDGVPSILMRVGKDYPSFMGAHAPGTPQEKPIVFGRTREGFEARSAYGFDGAQFKQGDTLESEFVLFARGYNALKRHRFEEAYQAFATLDYLYGWYYVPPDHYVFPYLARAGIKSGHRENVDMGLSRGREQEKEKPGDSSSFYYFLGAAFVSAEDGDHDEAISFMKKAFGVRPHTEMKPVMTWFQTVEACLSLHEDFGDPRYLALALDWSKRYQVVAPMYAWAYAVEAKYSKDPEERRRALGVAMYLDRHSWLLSEIPDADKRDALRWFEETKPFSSSGKTEADGKGA